MDEADARMEGRMYLLANDMQASTAWMDAWMDELPKLLIHCGHPRTMRNSTTRMENPERSVKLSRHHSKPSVAPSRENNDKEYTHTYCQATPQLQDPQDDGCKKLSKLKTTTPKNYDDNNSADGLEIPIYGINDQEEYLEWEWWMEKFLKLERIPSRKEVMQATRDFKDNASRWWR